MRPPLRTRHRVSFRPLTGRSGGSLGVPRTHRKRCHPGPCSTWSVPPGPNDHTAAHSATAPAGPPPALQISGCSANASVWLGTLSPPTPLLLSEKRRRSRRSRKPSPGAGSQAGDREPRCGAAPPPHLPRSRRPRSPRGR